MTDSSPVDDDVVGPRTRAALTAALDSIDREDTDAFARAVRELGRCTPAGSATGTLDRLAPFHWAAWVVSTASRAVLDHCYDTTWTDADGVNELTGLITPTWACPDRDIIGYLAVLAAGARGQAPPVRSVTTTKAATVAGLAVLAWARRTHGVSPLD